MVFARLYQKTFSSEYGGLSPDASLPDQLKAIQCHSGKIVSASHDGEVVVAAITPLMERAHTLQEAGEIVFIDASGNMDRRSHRVFLLLTWSAAGGLPLAVLITSSESEETISRGLQLIKDILPDGT